MSDKEIFIEIHDYGQCLQLGKSYDGQGRYAPWNWNDFLKEENDIILENYGVIGDYSELRFERPDMTISVPQGRAIHLLGDQLSQRIEDGKFCGDRVECFEDAIEGGRTISELSAKENA